MMVTYYDGLCYDLAASQYCDCDYAFQYCDRAFQYCDCDYAYQYCDCACQCYDFDVGEHFDCDYGDASL